MSRLQDDLLEVYNNLVELNEVVLGDNPCPVAVEYDEGMGCLSFKVPQKGLYLRPLNWYIIRPDQVKPTWLLPEDYDELMAGLQKVIKAGRLVQERICLAPKESGFDLYLADSRNLSRGAALIGEFRFWSGTGKWFNWTTKRKYKDIL